MLGKVRRIGANLRTAGDARRDRQQWQEAASKYKLYLTFHPGDGPIWVQLGHCLKESGQLLKASKAYERGRRLMPDDADVHVQLGHIAKLMGDFERARAEYHEAFTLDPSRFDAAEELRLHDPSYAQIDVDVVRARAANIAEARRDADRVARSKESLDDFRRKLTSLVPKTADTKIPRLLHFVYGFKESGDLPYYGYMAIKSALHHNPGWSAYYYSFNQPCGPNWDRVKDRVQVVLLDDFDYFGNARVVHYAHKADIVRMLVLNVLGGAYLDIDSITQKSFEDLLQEEYVMGVQAAGPDSSSGLCNAIMFGAPGARFSTRWLGEYDYFRSRGRDDLWDYHSVKLPVHLAARYPEEITVLDYRALFYPLWNSIQRVMFSDAGAAYADELAVARCFHLWNGATGSWLDNVDDAFVRTSRSVYARIARAVEGYPDPADAVHTTAGTKT